MHRAGELLARTRAFFSAKGISTARLDAELLLAHTLGIDRLRLFIDLDRPMKAAEVDAYRELVRRRASREPIAYILGHREFLGWRFEVTRDVLIPRPETEHLVEVAAAHLTRLDPRGAAFARQHLTPEAIEAALPPAPPEEGEGAPAPPAPPTRQRPRGVIGAEAAAQEGLPLRVADVATGSGIVGLCVARLFPAVQVTLTDLSPAALEVAGRNATLLQVAARTQLCQGHLTQPLAGRGPFHLIASNLPYIDPAVLPTLEPELRHEPQAALVAPEQGLGLLREFIAAAPAHLIAGGMLCLEIGHDQGEAVQQLLRQSGFVHVGLRRDLAGHARVAHGIMPEGSQPATC